MIELKNVSKVYKTYANPRHRLFEILSGGRKQFAKETWALDDVSFSLEKGARLGIVGENGSGKSTLLKVLAGVLTPTTGSVHVNGRISALLELGAGFNPEMTGEQNIRQFCMLHGLEQGQIEQALPEIMQFSELRTAIQDPVKTYSSGMSVRLGFACAVYVQPDILIVDEALSVGDSYFQNKCMVKIKSMLDNGVTFIYVTHAADAVRSLCNQGIWMQRGRMHLSGTAAEVGAAYQRSVFEKMTASVVAKSGVQKQSSNSASQQLFAERVAPLRTGSGEIQICDIELIDENGKATDSIDYMESIKIRVYYRVTRTFVEEFSISLGITDSNGNQLMHFNALEQGITIQPIADGTLRALEYCFTNPLCPGEYGVISGVGAFFKHPSKRGQLMVQHVVDHCAGGSRFTVRYPDGTQEHNLWSLVKAPFIVNHI